MRVRAVCPGAALLAFWFERCVQILHHKDFVFGRQKRISGKKFQKVVTRIALTELLLPARRVHL